MILVCVQCDSEFELTPVERKRYESKGFNLPRRCPECRRHKNRNDTEFPAKSKSQKNKKKFYYLKYGAGH